jgi:hypothetical protein
LGEEVHPGDGAGSNRYLRRTGKTAADPRTGCYLMEQQLLGLPACMTVVREREMALRFPMGKHSMGDWTWCIMGNFRRLMPGE